MMWLRTLIISSDPQSIQALTDILSPCAVEQFVCSTLSEAKVILAGHPIGLIFCQEDLLVGSYRDVLEEAEGAATPIPVVVTSRGGDWDSYLKAMRLGADDYIVYPYRRPDVERAVGRALCKCLVPA